MNTFKRWSKYEDIVLKEAVHNYILNKPISSTLSENEWNEISNGSFSNNRSGAQCKIRWITVIKPCLAKVIDDIFPKM